jgi:hypothetical protein
MSATAWDQLQARAFDTVSGDNDVAEQMAARQLLSMCGGDRRMVLATRIRLAAMAAREPDSLNPRRALALVDRAIALADGEGWWHPVFS